jgi:cation diffusion facilitator CzcD-associated flavoprotein CzcO
MEATVDKFQLRQHMRFNVVCLGATWVAKKSKWEVDFQDLMTGAKFTKDASVFVSAVGGISEPRDVTFPGMEKFKGTMFHTARWNHAYDYTGKRMAIIGNGCSAAQVVPNVVNKVSYIKQ